MILFDNGGALVQPGDPLPEIPDSIERLYADFETTSRDKDLDSLDVWHHCWAAGIAVTWDSSYRAYYLPIGHHDARWNLDRETVVDWLRTLFSRAKMWVNHNIKYDVHVLFNDLGIDWDAYRRPTVCTVVGAKIVDSDRMFKGGYGLDALSEAWLGEDISRYELAFRAYLEDSAEVVRGKKKKQKDYGRVPADLMGEYACQDVITNRRLDHYIEANTPLESKLVAENERKLTSILVRGERRGLYVKPAVLNEERLYALTDMLEIEQKLHEKVGYRFNPVSTNDCFDVLCNHYGLPVIAWTGDADEDEVDEETGEVVPSGNPSFNIDALLTYKQRIDAPKEVIDLMIDYRHLSTLKGLFLKKYVALAVDVEGDYAALHPDHNQCVRTGRMSVKRPNSQQLNKRAKSLILPGPGMSILSADASQIEFRTMAHYTEDPDVIAAYAANPDVDFHALVATMVGTKRRPAKTINFSIGFGQGKASTIEQLAVNEDVVLAIMATLESMIEAGEVHPDAREDVFKMLARQKGEAVYEAYHEKFPGVKITAKQAARACRERGFVRNVMGRRRYLPEKFAHKAFNTVNQSSAADIVKSRMVDVDDALIGTGIMLITQVHDELVFVGPTPVIEDYRTQRDIIAILEDVHCLKVPVRFKYGYSSLNWADASGQDRSIPVEDIKQARRLEHLKPSAA